jgi:hypothetical protein
VAAVCCAPEWLQKFSKKKSATRPSYDQ